MNDLLATLLPLLVLLVIRAWRTGAIQSTVGKYTPKLPAWAQWIPPMALNVSATLVVWLVQGVSTATLSDTLAQGGTSGIVTIGLWHVAKRVIPVVAVDQVRIAAARSGLTILLILLLLGGGQACSGSPQTIPTVCLIPSQYLAALPPPAAVASAVQAAQGVVEQAKAVTQDPDAAAAVLVASRALDTVEPLCPSLTELAKTDCAAKVAEARATIAKGDATREQVCSAVRLAVIVAQIAEDSVPIVALEGVCR